VIKPPKPARRAVPSPATRRSHARGRKPFRVIPCCWQATNGRAAVVHGGRVEAREVDVVEVCTQLTWPARILRQSDIEDRHGIACAALQGRIDHHYLSLRCVGGGHPSGFGLHRACDTRLVGQDANDDDTKAPIVLPAATASRWEMITRHQASAFASGQARPPASNLPGFGTPTGTVG
jgi:hypothetical protein